MSHVGGARKYASLLDDVDVKRWFDNLARGSKITADIYLRRLGRFCVSHGLTPKDLVSMTSAQVADLLMDTVTAMEREGNSGSYIETVVKVIRSWLDHNGEELKTKIKIRGARDTPSLKDERIPTQDELRRILASGDKKTRAASILVAHSGLRLETVGNYTGDDGLRVKDLPEMLIKDDMVSFAKIPAMVTVRRDLSKARHQYLTFLSEEGCEYLRDYLEERMRDGEELGPESSIVTPKLRMKPFIRAINVGDSIRGAIRKAGFKWRPYVLRSYFDTRLMLAESHGLILRDYRQFWMGHKGDIENRYTTNKQRLSEDVVDDMREAYSRSQEYLSTSKVEKTNEEQIKAAFKKQLLLVAGFKQDEIDKMDLSSISDEEFQSLVRQRLLGSMANNGAKQKIVTLDDIENNLTQGWEFVANLPNNRAIMKIPF
jgi:integrase